MKIGQFSWTSYVSHPLTKSNTAPWVFFKLRKTWKASPLFTILIIIPMFPLTLQRNRMWKKERNCVTIALLEHCIILN